MHFTQQSVIVFAAILAAFAIGMAMYTANKNKNKGQ